MVEGGWLWITWEKMVFGYLVLMQLWEESSINVWHVGNCVEGLVTRKCQICQKKDVKELRSFIVGSFIIRERRANLKQYCVLFTSFSSRAVHIEVTCTMETDSFIQTLCRFMARWGKLRSIRFDNETDFVGTDNELRKALEEMNQEQIRDYLLQNGTDWITWYKNPSGATLMGGVWECQILKC